MEPDVIRIKQIKPALSGYLRESLELLRAGRVPDDDAIHDIRVLMKKSRAALKLLHPCIGDKVFDDEYKTYRDAARMLSSWRDISVQRKTLRSIRKNNRKLFNRLEGFKPLDEILNNDGTVSEENLQIISNIREVEDSLRKAWYRLRFLTTGNPDPALMFEQLNNSYKSASSLCMECRINSKPSKIHELRKRTKDFLYQIYFFRPVNPPQVKSAEKRLEIISRNLGNYNDISQIIASLDYKYGNPANPPELDELVALLKGLQDEYLADVWPSAFKIFKPGQKLQTLLGITILRI